MNFRLAYFALLAVLPLLFGRLRADGELGGPCLTGQAPCDDENAECMDGTCGCRDGYVADPDVCRMKAGENCTEAPNDCVFNANCTDPEGDQDFLCECDLGFLADLGGRCRLPRLGEECEPEVGCFPANSSCDDDGSGNSICSCDVGFVQDKWQCRLPFLGEECQEVPGCSVWKSECVDDGNGTLTCNCMNGYTEDKGQCRIPNAGEECRPEVGCHALHSECVNGTEAWSCECLGGYTEEQGRCRLPIVQEECLPGVGCSTPNSECSNGAGEWICECKNGYRQDGVECRLPVLGEGCLVDTGCSTANSSCVVGGSGTGTCECVNGTMAYEGNCILFGEELGDPCDLEFENVTCGVPNAICVEGPFGISCGCKDGWVVEDNSCKIGVGSECDGDDCVQNASCENGECACDEGFKEDEVHPKRCASSGAMAAISFGVLAVSAVSFAFFR